MIPFALYFDPDRQMQGSYGSGVPFEDTSLMMNVCKLGVELEPGGWAVKAFRYSRYTCLAIVHHSTQLDESGRTGAFRALGVLYQKSDGLRSSAAAHRLLAAFSATGIDHEGSPVLSVPALQTPLLKDEADRWVDTASYRLQPGVPPAAPRRSRFRRSVGAQDAPLATRGVAFASETSDWLSGPSLEVALSRSGLDDASDPWAILLVAWDEAGNAASAVQRLDGTYTTEFIKSADSRTLMAVSRMSQPKRSNTARHVLLALFVGAILCVAAFWFGTEFAQLRASNDPPTTIEDTPTTPSTAQTSISIEAPPDSAPFPSTTPATSSQQDG